MRRRTGTGFVTAKAAMPGLAQDPEFEAFYADQLPRLLRYCAMLSLSQHAAQDITQEAFVQVLRRWPSIANPAAYLRATAYHLAIRRPAEEPWRNPADCRRLPEVLPELPGFEERHAVLRACRELPGQQRAVFALYFDGYPAAEIAEILQMKTVTVRSHLRHAREKLRSWWEHENGQGPGTGGTPR
jgi:RNA polymerase sigma factor (sigma-70 family)